MTMTNQHTDSVLIQQMEILKGDNTMTTTPDYNDEAVAAGPRVWWIIIFPDGEVLGSYNFNPKYCPPGTKTIRVIEQPESDT
jgi:hypothetical protein